MQPEFWLQSWQEGGVKTSFHRRDLHPYIEAYAPAHFLRGKHVLVPLCGKDNALLWFREHASHVTGVELAETAIIQFFEDNEISFTKTPDGRYEAPGITIFHRDIFDLTLRDIGPIEFIYDRAALVALPEELRARYRAKIDEFMLPGVQSLVITLEFLPYLGNTPPFSITPGEMKDYFGENYIIDHVEKPSLPEHRMVEKFKLDFLKEHAFVLTKTADKSREQSRLVTKISKFLLMDLARKTPISSRA